MRLLLACVLAISLTGCNEKRRTKVEPTAERIGEIQGGIGDETSNIDTQATLIDQATDNGVIQHTDSIRGSTSRIDELTKELSDVRDSFEDSQADNDKLRAQIADLQDANQRKIRLALNTIGIASIVGAGVAVSLGFWLRMKPLFLVAACLGVVGALCLALSIYLKIVAIAALSLLGLGAAYVVWIAIRERQAVKELVSTGEEAKKSLEGTERELVFGDNGAADRIQSKRTKKVVKQLRS